MRRLLIINNIPSHYRAFMFNTMSQRGRAYGVEVTVAFQAAQEPHRPWKPEHFDMRFPYFISSGFNPWRRAPNRFATPMTFNTDILRRVMSGSYDWVLMAPLMSLGTGVIALAPSGRTLKLLWSESNMTSARYLSGPVRWVKRALQAPFSMSVCPGQRAVDYVCHFNPELSRRPVLWLPNIVDTSVYHRRVKANRARRVEIRSAIGVAPDEILVVGVGQMVERKGFHLLIEAAAAVDGRFKIVLIGDGPLRGPWEERLGDLGLAERIRLPGQGDPDEIARYFAAADWFIHTALQDPSPLVVIEAAVAGLPMAVSTQTGNSPEGVLEGENGFTFDVTDPADLRSALERIDTVAPDERRRMGLRSAALARERFDPDGVVNRFFEELLEHTRRATSAA